MSDLQAIADRFEIESLRGEFTGAVMMRDYDCVALLLTPDGAWRMPNIPSNSPGRRRSARRASGCRSSWTTSCSGGLAGSRPPGAGQDRASPGRRSAG